MIKCRITIIQNVQVDKYSVNNDKVNINNNIKKITTNNGMGQVPCLAAYNIIFLDTRMYNELISRALKINIIKIRLLKLAPYNGRVVHFSTLKIS